MAKVHNQTAFRLVWLGDEFQAAFEEMVSGAMADLMLEAETEARNRLGPGHGYDTGTMHNRTHVAVQGFAWETESVDPIPGGGPDLGGKRVLPTKQSGGRAHGALVLELGCGQAYTVFYHQHHDPFIRIAWERANAQLLPEIQARWAAEMDVPFPAGLVGA